MDRAPGGETRAKPRSDVSGRSSSESDRIIFLTQTHSHPLDILAEAAIELELQYAAGIEKAAAKRRANDLADATH